MIVVQWLFRISCLLPACVFTHSCLQTIIAPPSLLKIMYHPHWQRNAIFESFEEKGFWEMYFQTFACEAEETIEVGISHSDFTVDKPRQCISVLIFLHFNAQDGLLKKKKKAYWIVVYIFLPADIVWKFFPVGYTCIVLLGIVSCPPQRMY